MFVTVNFIVVEVLCSVHSGVELFQTRYVIVVFECSHAKFHHQLVEIISFLRKKTFSNKKKNISEN